MRGTRVLRLVVVLLSFLITPPGGFADDLQAWSNLGLYGGHVYDLAIDPVQPAKIFAGTYLGGGLFVSHNGGTNWQSVTMPNYHEGEDTFKDQAVYAVAIAPSNPDVVWVAHNYWVAKSIDGGITWRNLPNALMQRDCQNCGGEGDNFRLCKAIAIDPNDPMVVYVGTSGYGGANTGGALYKTIDGGDSWIKLNQGGNFGYGIEDLSIDGQNRNVLWAVTNSNGDLNVWNGSIYRSTDGGQNFASIPNQPYLGGISGVSVKPDDSSVVFVSCAYGLIRLDYDDQSAQWQFSQAVPGSVFATDAQFAPSNPDIVYTCWYSDPYYGGDGLPKISRSANGGLTWQTYSLDTRLAGNLSVLAIHPTDPAMVYGGDWTLGIIGSPDHAQNWTARNEGLDAVIVYDIDLDGGDSSHMIAATSGGVFERSDGTWQRRLNYFTKAVSFDAFSSGAFYAGLFGYVGKTTNHGADWSFSNFLGQADVSHIAVDSEDPATLFVTAGTQVQRSHDGGALFTPVLEGVNQAGQPHPMNVVAIDPSDTNRIFAGGGNFYAPYVAGDLWMSTDRGDTWQRTGLTDVIVNDVIIDPAAPHMMYAGCGFSNTIEETTLFKSTDGGATWMAQTTGMPLPAWRMTGLWVAADNSGIATAWNGRAFHISGSALREMDTGTGNDLYGVFGISAADVYAVGRSGTILHYDGTGWSSMNSGTNHDIRSIWGDAPGNLIAVGADGLILKYDGNQWLPMPSATGHTLNAVFGTSADNIFAVGEGGIILHFDGGHWIPMNSGTTHALYDVWGTAGVFFAVGAQGALLKFDGLQWSSLPGATSHNVTSVWGSSATRVYAAADAQGQILHYDGAQWTVSTIAGEPSLAAVWGAATDSVFAVGDKGGVFHYTGGEWVALRPSGSRLRAVTDLAFNRHDPGTVYAGTLGAGVFVSPDRAGRWLNLGTPPASVYAISAGSLYAATGAGVHQCSGIGVIAGYVRNQAGRSMIDNATVATDLGNRCPSIGGMYMMVVPAGIFNLFAAADNYQLSRADNIAVYGGEVTWRDFDMNPVGAFVPDRLPENAGSHANAAGGGYCFIGTAIAPGTRLWLIAAVMLAAIAIPGICVGKRNKSAYLFLAVLGIMGVRDACGFTIFEQVGVASAPVPVGSGARAMGMGGAFIAVADDATAASWNPAGLIQLEKPELSIVGAFTSRRSDFQSDTHPEIDSSPREDTLNLNYLSASYPFHLIKNIVISINYQQLYDFERSFEHPFDFSGAGIDLRQQVRYSQSGRLSALGIAGAVELTPRLSLGITCNVWTDELGWDNGWEETYQAVSTGSQSGVPVSIDTRIGDEYEKFRGINFNVGLLWDTGRWGNFGAVVKTPFTASLVHRFHFQQTQVNGPPLNTTTTTGPLTIDEEIELEMPWSFGLGWSKRYGDRWTLSLDVSRTYWDDYTLIDGQGQEFSPVDGRPKAQSRVDPTTHVRAGFEYLFLMQGRKLAFPLRGGLFYDPEPFQGSPNDFFGASLGGGLTGHCFSLDVAYQIRWGRDIDTGNLIATSHADVIQHLLLTSLIYYF
ncbi:MAG: hypothetical protein C4519_11580 [Desulfobacteraceae bacterium]|nr:MAG: hypothetical protein C4519_11580 [Desulfobacteraceae bacterium]